MNFHKKYKIYDLFRNVEIKHMTGMRMDRQGNVNLIIYIDKANPNREILERDKIYCNEFRFEEVEDEET